MVNCVQPRRLTMVKWGNGQGTGIGFLGGTPDVVELGLNGHPLRLGFQPQFLSLRIPAGGHHTEIRHCKYAVE